MRSGALSVLAPLRDSFRLLRRSIITAKDADNGLIICRCEEVSKREIVEAISEGCDTVTWVKRKTRAGMGLCQGRTCGCLVAKIIAEETDQHPGHVLPDTRRPPVRPISLDILEEKDEEEGRK